jgi:hypothetical protein
MGGSSRMKVSLYLNACVKSKEPNTTETNNARTHMYMLHWPIYKFTFIYKHLRDEVLVLVTSGASGKMPYWIMNNTLSATF